MTAKRGSAVIGLMRGPYPVWTFIYCREDEAADYALAAFPNETEAAEHARQRLSRMPPDWISVVVACGHVDSAIEFVGSWEREPEGALRWDAASLA